MQKIIFSLALILIGTFAQAKEWTTVRVVTEGAFPPFTMIDKSGKLVGFEIDLVNALCKEMKLTCTIDPLDWDGLIPALLAKKYDAIFASMSITEERKKVVIFSNPYVKGFNQFIAKKGQFKDVSVATLKGRKVGVQVATISEHFLKDNYPETTLKTYSSIDDAFLDLQSGRIDLVFNDSVVTEEGFLKTAVGKNYAFIGPGFSDKKWFGEGAGAAFRPEDKELQALFNEGIKRLYKNGVFKKINKKYLPNQDLMIKG